LISEGKSLSIDRQPFPAQWNNVLSSVAEKYRLVTGNITDLGYVLNVIRKFNVDGIIHLAGMLAAAALEHPIEGLQVNIIGPANMLEAARILNLRRVILTSSSVVYGSIDDVVTPRREEEIALPVSGIYAVSKLTVEQLAYTYRGIYGVDCVVCRPHGVYGPGELGHPSHQPTDEMVRDAFAGKPIIHESGGDSVSGLTYVKDYATGVIKAYDHPNRLPHYVYNLGYGRNWTMFEVAEVLRKLFPKLEIKLGPGLWSGALAKGEQKDMTYRIEQRPPHDNKRARRDFGYNPEWPIERAIPDWIRWLTERKY
jgi:nucleoside-diphosphate-sugar epimerase